MALLRQHRRQLAVACTLALLLVPAMGDSRGVGGSVVHKAPTAALREVRPRVVEGGAQEQRAAPQHQPQQEVGTVGSAFMQRIATVAERLPSPDQDPSARTPAPPTARMRLVSVVEVTGERMRDFTQWHGDIFGISEKILREPLTLDERSKDWLILAITTISLVAFDSFVLQRTGSSNASVSCHVLMLMFWLTMASIFGAFVYVRHGPALFAQWCSGYVLEWLLSMDNLFVFHIVFTSFATPPQLLHKALFYGILGAVVFRALFFVALHNLLHLHYIFRYLFGLILVYSGIQAAREDEDDDEDPKDRWLVRALTAALGQRLYDGYDSDRIVTKRMVGNKSVICFTLMLPVIFCLELTDLLFAVDSVSAKVAQIPDQFMNYSSSVLAMFGLRAMFFLIRDMVQYFTMMKYGLCFILVFIGVELIFSER